MKLFVQIPCFNEEKTIGSTIKDLPKDIPGISEIKIIVIDDGSTDKTVREAISAGVDYVVQNRSNKGLSRTFSIGLEHCLALGADLIVNTDGDNQYNGASTAD